MIEIIRTNSTNTDFQELVVLLDEDLSIRDGDDHSFYAQFNKIDQIRHVVVAFEDGRPVGCGAFKEFEPQVAEIKRMFVRPDARGRGIGKQVLQELELWAAELNFSECILETGTKQPEAIALYKGFGYRLTQNYGQYKGIENSVCMQKTIGVAG